MSDKSQAQIQRMTELMDELVKTWNDPSCEGKTVPQTSKDILEVSKGLLERVDRGLSGGGEVAATTVTVTVTITVTTLREQEFEQPRQ